MSEVVSVSSFIRPSHVVMLKVITSEWLVVKAVSFFSTIIRGTTS